MIDFVRAPDHFDPSSEPEGGVGDTSLDPAFSSAKELVTGVISGGAAPAGESVAEASLITELLDMGTGEIRELASEEVAHLTQDWAPQIQVYAQDEKLGIKGVQKMGPSLRFFSDPVLYEVEESKWGGISKKEKLMVGVVVYWADSQGQCKSHQTYSADRSKVPEPLQWQRNGTEAVDDPQLSDVLGRTPTAALEGLEVASFLELQEQVQ